MSALAAAAGRLSKPPKKGVIAKQFQESKELTKAINAENESKFAGVAASSGGQLAVVSVLPWLWQDPRLLPPLVFGTKVQLAAAGARPCLCASTELMGGCSRPCLPNRTELGCAAAPACQVKAPPVLATADQKQRAGKKP